MTAVPHQICAPLGSISLLLALASCSFDTSTRVALGNGMPDATVIDATNQAPIANPQLVTVVEDVPKGITLTGSAPEGAALSFALVSGPTVGTLTGTPPDLTYTPGLLFFSAMTGLGASVNQTNSYLDFALATAPFGLGNGDRFIQMDGATAGSGVGFTMFRGVPKAAEFGSAGLPLNDVNNAPSFSENVNGLIVGKITWGATPAEVDTVELFQPSADLTILGAAFSTLQMTVDQVTFDTMTMHRGERVVIDEIRFGRSLSSVLVGP